MGSRFKRAWNTFFNRDPTHSYNDTGPGYFYRPDRTRFSRGNERSIVTSVYNRISLWELLLALGERGLTIHGH